jgi:hypothetical protein
MSRTALDHPLLQDTAGGQQHPEVPEGAIEELSDLALATDNVTARSWNLYQQLRKMIGQPRLVSCLLGIQSLAHGGEPAGARLLAALLDANTPGSILLPRIRGFGSSHRVLCRLASDPRPPAHLRDWRQRLEEAAGKARRAFPGVDEGPAGDKPRPGQEAPFPLLRTVLRQLAKRGAEEESLTVDEAALLVELVRLEVDAYQERVSALAGDIDPFAVTAVARVLPILSRADAEIRDQRQLVGWIEEGDFHAAFRRRVPRCADVLEERESERFRRTVAEEEELAPLAGLLRGLLVNPLPVRQLAAGMARLMALSHQLVRAGARRTELDPLVAARLVQENQTDTGFRLALDPELARTVGTVLMAPQLGPGLASWSLDGLEVVRDVLVLHEPDLGLSDRVWKHDLPTVADTDPELVAMLAEVADEEDEEDVRERPDRKADMSVAAVKQLVMNNIGSTSIVLGFLRNDKITGIPGLVASVARRTRSARVLEVIAGDRKLYTGHANKDVPLACLLSPCNVSVKLLRKFVHVKYVAKVDLKRIANDPASVRPEVAAEVKNYIESLC